MENIKCIPNWVLIKFDNSNEYIKVGKEKLYIDTTFEPQRRAQVKGVVVSFPKELYFYPEDSRSTAFNVPVEIQEGDTVLFHFNSVATALKQGRLWKEKEDNFMFVPYDQLFTAIRDGKIIPLNGYIFVEPEKETIESSVIIPDIMQNNLSKTKGTVRYMGCKVKEYLNPELSDDGVDIQIGDKVHFREVEAVPIHDSYNTELKGFYRLHRSGISGVYDRV